GFIHFGELGQFTVGAFPHRAELVADERLAAAPDAHLFEEDRSRRIKLDGDSDQQKDWREKDRRNQTESDVDGALNRKVPAADGDLAYTDEWYAIDIIDRYPVERHFVQVGDDLDRHMVTLALVENRENLIVLVCRQRNHHHIGAMLAQNAREPANRA